MRLEPFFYHQRVAEALENNEKKLWKWFSSDSFAEGYREQARRELSNSSVRLSPDDNEANDLRYRLAKRARDALGLSADIVLTRAMKAMASLTRRSSTFLAKLQSNLLAGSWNF